MGIQAYLRSRICIGSVNTECCSWDCGTRYRTMLPLCFNTSGRWRLTRGLWAKPGYVWISFVSGSFPLFNCDPLLNKSVWLKPSLVRSKVKSFFLGLSLGETTRLIMDSLSFSEPEFSYGQFMLSSQLHWSTHFWKRIIVMVLTRKCIHIFIWSF